MPEGWEKMWPEFYNHVYNIFKKVGTNEFDDAEDCLTGIAEYFGEDDRDSTLKDIF